MTSYRTAKIQPSVPWSPIDEPYRDPGATAALLLSWLPALLCGVRIEAAPATCEWFMRGTRLSLLLPKIRAVAP